MIAGCASLKIIMCDFGRLKSTLGSVGPFVGLLVGLGMAVPDAAAGQEPEPNRQTLLEHIGVLEQRLNQVRAAEPSEARGGTTEAAEANEAEGAGGGQEPDLRALLERLDALEQRLSELETMAVLSEPETRVRRVEVWVDDDGIEHDQQVDGARRVVTYQRERVYRRQTIGEKIEEALAGQADSSVLVGVDAAITTQFASRTMGDSALANGQAYELASAALFFTARIAQHTVFFADVVGLSGSPPDNEIPSLSLINGYTARLGRRDELNLREAWLRTELFSQTLAISAGRLDLTNYFDRNAAANDETSQFLSDTLVNNPALGLSSNGTGVAAVFDPKRSVNLKVGFQQSNPEAINLSQSIYSLVEVGYVATPFPTGEGNYRVWFRSDNTTGQQATAFGVSLDQKVSPWGTLFARFGSSEADVGRDRFYSIGMGVQNGLVMNRWDTWGVGYSYSELDVGDREHVGEFYYGLGLSERLRLSLHLQYFKELPMAANTFSYLVPGVRFQAGF